MTRALVWLLILAVMAVALALGASQLLIDGYAMFVLPPWRAELSLNFFLVALVVLFIVLHIAVRLIQHIKNLPRSVADFQQRRAVMRSADILQEAYRLVTEGRYGHALRVLETNYVGHAQAPMMALLGWRAAHALRDAERVAVWRQRASESASAFESARLITEAELALADREYAEADAALRQHAATGRLQIATIRLQLRAAQGLGHWREVARLARQLEKYRGMTADQARPIRTRAQLENLAELDGNLSGLRRFWSELDSDGRTDSKLAQGMAKRLIAVGEQREAQGLIEVALNANWDSQLVALYADCHGGEMTARLARAEKWLQQHPQDDVLLLVLGRLCVEQHLWGKAKSFLEASLALRETRAANIELARLHEQLDELVLATRRYNAAALLP